MIGGGGGGEGGSLLLRWCDARLCPSFARQGHGGQRRLHGHCAVHQPAVAVGQGALAGAELPAEAQHEDDTTTATGVSFTCRFARNLVGNRVKLTESNFAHLVFPLTTHTNKGAFYQ